MRVIMLSVVIALLAPPLAAAEETTPSWRIGVDVAGGARHIAASAGTRRTGWVAQLAVRPHVVGPLSLGVLGDLDQRQDVSGTLRIVQTRLGVAPFAEAQSSGPVRAVGRLGLGWAGTWTAWKQGPGTVDGASGADIDPASLPSATLRSRPLFLLDAGVRFAPKGPLRITALFSLQARGPQVDLGGTLGVGVEI